MTVTKEEVKRHFGACKDIDENTFRTQCPVHKGKSQSLIVFIKDNKWVNGYCHNESCDDQDVQQYIDDLGYNKSEGGFSKGHTNQNKKPPRHKLISPVTSKYIEHWQRLMTELHDNGYVLNKNFWVYSDIKGKQICAMYRVDKGDQKNFYPKMLELDTETGVVSIVSKGPPEPKPLYLSNKHRTKNREINTLHVYEGEKTTCAGEQIFRDSENILHVTWGFGSSSYNKADWKSLSIFKFDEVVLFPDNDEAGRKAMDAIAQKLYELGHTTIRVVDTSSFPEKWDVADITTDEEVKKLGELYEKAKLFQAEVPLEYAYVNDQDVFYNLKRGIMYGSSHFGRILLGQKYIPPGGSKPVDSVKTFLESTDTMKIDTLEFDPGKPKTYKENGASCLNSYIPYYIRPIEGDVQPFLDLLNIWIPDDTDRGNGEWYRHWATCWWAHNIQYPGKKIMSAPVWISPEGYGKGTVFRLFQSMLGREYVVEVTQRQLESGFNPFVFRKLMIFFDELRVEQSSRINVMNRLKFYITEPMVSYNDKYRLERDIPNTFNISCHSNSRTAITLKDDARRWFCHYIEQQPPQELFEKLNQMQRNAPGVLLKYFKEYDLSEFDPYKEPPKTEFFYEICEATDNMGHKWLENRFRSDMHPFHPESSLVVIEDLNEMAAQIPGSKGVNETSILSWLNAKGALSLGQMRIHGMRKSFWDLRPGRIRPPTMAELVREYQLPQVRYDGSKKIFYHLDYEQQRHHFKSIQDEGKIVEQPF